MLALVKILQKNTTKIRKTMLSGHLKIPMQITTSHVQNAKQPLQDH